LLYEGEEILGFQSMIIYLYGVKERSVPEKPPNVDTVPVT